MQCFEALGFREMPASREAVENAYAQRKKAGAENATASEQLAARLLEENYRACLRLLEAAK